VPDVIENPTERLLQESSDIDSMNVTLINLTSTDEGTIRTIGVSESTLVNKAYSVETAYTKKMKQPTIDEHQPWPRRPNGSHSYKVNLIRI
jgi:transcription elongation GreA/GreB family factor